MSVFINNCHTPWSRSRIYGLAAVVGEPGEVALRVQANSRPAVPGRTIAGGAPDLRLSLIGGFEVHGSGRSISLPLSSQRLVAYLALHERPALRPHVAGTLWPDTSEERAMANLRSVLWRLRRIEHSLVETVGDLLSLASEVAVDVRRLRDVAHLLLDRSNQAPSGQADELARAGELLPDWSDEWVLVERERFRQLQLHALERLGHDLAMAGRYGRAVEIGLAAVAAEPLRESAHHLLIAVHLAEGNRAEALRQYEHYRRLMDEELGLRPSRQMEELVHELTRGALATMPPATGRRPRAYEDGPVATPTETIGSVGVVAPGPGSRVRATVTWSETAPVRRSR